MAADAHHFADLSHGIDQVLLHGIFRIHCCYLQIGYVCGKRAGKCSIKINARLWDECDRNQVRSERIRLLPYSFIALTRSCFTEIFFIAIPPYNLGRITACELFLNKTCKDGRRASPLKCEHYSILTQRKKVV